MCSRYIITTHWWADTAARRAWPLLAESGRWPLWWSSIAQVQVLQSRSASPGNRLWRVALGRPLRLAVATLASQPQQWLTLSLQGDLRGSATLMLEPCADQGLDITCRCELQAPRGAPRPWAWLFERRMRNLLQALATDLGRTLQCRVQLLGTWQGRWQGTGWSR